MRTLALPLLLSTACLTGNGVSATRSFDVFGAEALDHRTFVDLEVRRSAKAELAITCDENLLGAFRTRIEDATLVIDTVDPFLDPRTDCRGTLSLPELRSIASRGSGRLTVLGEFAETHRLDVQGSGSVDVRTPVRSLEDARVSGSGSLLTSTIEGCDLEIQLEGSGKVGIGELNAGMVGPCAARIRGTGSGSLTIDALTTPQVRVETQGSGRIRLAGQTEVFVVRASGSGQVSALELTSNQGDLEGRGSGDIEATVLETLRLRLSGSGDARVGGQPALQDVQVSGSGRLRIL